MIVHLADGPYEAADYHSTLQAADSEIRRAVHLLGALCAFKLAM